MTPDQERAFQDFLDQWRLNGAVISPRWIGMLREAWQMGAKHERLRLSPNYIRDDLAVGKRDHG